MVGKHGDHVGGERDAVKALVAGEVDAACVIDGNQLAFAEEGTIAAGAVRVLTRTAPYDHCTMTVLDDVDDDVVDRFVELLLSMSLRRSRGAAAARPRRAEAVAARSHRRATSSSRRRSTGCASTAPTARSWPRTTALTASTGERCPSSSSARSGSTAAPTSW